MQTIKPRGKVPIKFTKSSISNLKNLKHMSGAPKCDSYSEEYSTSYKSNVNTQYKRNPYGCYKTEISICVFSYFSVVIKHQGQSNL